MANLLAVVHFPSICTSCINVYVVTAMRCKIEKNENIISRLFHCSTVAQDTVYGMLSLSRLAACMRATITQTRHVHRAFHTMPFSVQRHGYRQLVWVHRQRGSRLYASDMVGVSQQFSQRASMFEPCERACFWLLGHSCTRGRIQFTQQRPY